jgi:predicted CopG family antitoxin
MDGFGGNPLDRESWWMMTDGMALRAARYGIFNDVENFARENGLYNFALNLVKGKDVERLLGTNYTARKATLAKPLQKEVMAAKILEDNGHTVFFTPENKRFLNYDAIIDGRLGEFKHPESFSKIIVRLNKADDQRASIVCLTPTIGKNTQDETIKKIKNWFSNSQKPINYVDTVLLIWEGAVIPIKK